MFDENTVTLATGVSKRQLETLASYGMISREQRGVKGRRGSRTHYAADTPEIFRIVLAHLRERHTYPEAAEEVILAGYTPAKPRLVRQWLSDYCQRMAQLVDLRIRHKEAASPSRAQLTRNMRTFADKLPVPLAESARDVLQIALLGSNGVLPNNLRGMLLPDDKLLDWRRLRTLLNPAQTTDARLMQALADAREACARDADVFVGQMQTFFNITPDDWVRAWLPGHICLTHHSPAQAMLPRSVLGYLDPMSSSQDRWVNGHRVGPEFASLLERGVPELFVYMQSLGEHFGDSKVMS